LDELRAIYEAMQCPVCGLQLDFKPWNGESPSHEICPQCGMHFGYYDVGRGDRRQYYEQWRAYWRSSASDEAAESGTAAGGGGV
jgi:Zn ribbon nucleic-acid-binding protein